MRFLLALSFLFMGFALKAETSDQLFWIQVKAKDKFERSKIADLGVSIEKVEGEKMNVIGSEKDIKKLHSLGVLIESKSLDKVSVLDFPDEDSSFHNYAELTNALEQLRDENPDIVTLDSIGNSLEGRAIHHVIISSGPSKGKAAIVFMGGHHAREHLSIETPLLIMQYLTAEYKKGNERVRRLVDNRVIHFIPVVNPDGAEYDIVSGRYKSWRKNRRANKGGTYGVDLNRNYDHEWGTVGASPDPNSQTYHGPSAFSEPETQAIKSFIESNDNITTLLTYHSFSELILYPWGHTFNPIANGQDRSVFETMANKMAGWNKYTPQQSSDLYRTSGETCDWAYGIHGIFAFTFELDPDSMWKGGFYPGQSYIDVVFGKNLEPALYLMEYADNPYRVLEPQHKAYGLSSPLIN